MHGVRQRLLRAARDQLVQFPQERGQRFPGPRRSQDQRMLAAGDRWPALSLRIARLAERVLEPLPDKGMKPREDRRITSHFADRNRSERVLEHAPQLLRSPFENFARQRSLPELLELDFLGPFEVVHEY